MAPGGPSLGPRVPNGPHPRSPAVPVTTPSPLAERGNGPELVEGPGGEVGTGAGWSADNTKTAMVLAVCLNGGPDKVYEVPGFSIHGIHRPTRVIDCVGGKGNNFARVLHRLGHAVRILGFSAGWAGRFMEDSLRREGLGLRMLRVAGESRLTTTIVDPAGSVHTEVNEIGPEIGPGDVDRAIAVFREEIAARPSFCVIAGSAPPGAPDGIYSTMIAECRRAGVPVMLDASRRWLLGSAESPPDVLKPNQPELSTLIGREVAGRSEAACAARDLVARGTPTVLVTLGDDGALAVTSEESLHACPTCELAVISAVASGDAFAAGYVAALLEGRPLRDRLGMAVACGAANAEVFGPGFIERGRAEQILASVVVDTPSPRTAGRGLG